MSQHTTDFGAADAPRVYHDHKGSFDPLDYFLEGIRGSHLNPLSRNTARSYRAAWRKFESWCHRRGACPVPATAETLVEYVRFRRRAVGLATSSRRSSVRIALCAVRHLHRRRRLVDPTVEAWQLNVRLDEVPSRRDVITRAELQRILSKCDQTFAGLRQRCLLTLAFDELLHARELANLNVEDFSPGDDKRYASLSYPSVFDHVKRKHPLTDRSSEAIQSWIRSAQIAQGPLFRPQHRRGPRLHASAATLYREIRRADENQTINFRVLHRGRSIELSAPDARRERTVERCFRQHASMAFHWRDEPSPMLQMAQECAAHNQEGEGVHTCQQF